MTAYRGGITGAAVANTDDGLTVGPASPVAQVGDLLLAAVAGAVSTSPTYYLPTGWRLVPNAIAFDTGSPGVALGVYYKRATADDLADTTFTWDPTHGAVVALSIYSPSSSGREVRVVEAAAAAASASSATRTTPSITTAGSRWLVSFYADRSGSTWTVPSGQTQRHVVNRGAGAVSLLVTDSNGETAASSYSRSVTASASSGTRVEVIVALEDALAAPVVTVPDSLSVEPFDTATLTAYATAGTISWAQRSGPAVTLTPAGTGTITITAPATMDGGAVVLRASATSNSQTGASDMTITIPPHNEWVSLGGAWNAVQIMLGGAITPPATYDTTPPTTTLSSPSSGSTTSRGVTASGTYTDDGPAAADTTAPTTTLTSPSASSTTSRSTTAQGAYTDA